MRKINCLRILFALLIISQIAFAQKPHVKVFILAGQSNMAGTYLPLISELPSNLEDTIPNVLIKIKSYGNNSDWGALRPGLGETSSNFGPEITFGIDMLSFLNDTIAIIKYAYGWTSLDCDWRPTSSGGSTGVFYSGLIEEINTDLNYLSSIYEVELAGMCWMQGEKDASELDLANAYETNLTNFINDLRLKLQLPNLPFVIGMIENSVGWPYRAEVRQAEINVSQNLANIGIFDTYGLPSDNYHFNTQGKIQLGHLFASTIIQVINNIQIVPDNKIEFYPNPVSTEFFINSDRLESFQYEIINSAGILVQVGIARNGINKIDVQSLESGLFFIRTLSNKRIAIKKLIKIQ